MKRRFHGLENVGDVEGIVTATLIRALVPWRWTKRITPTVGVLSPGQTGSEDLIVPGFLTTDSLEVEYIQGTLPANHTVVVTVPEDDTIRLTFECLPATSGDFDPTQYILDVTALD